MDTLILANAVLFLSTLSLRRATETVSIGSHGDDNFYPRSPCGERHGPLKAGQTYHCISIHALLAESDLFFQNQFFVHNLFLSTLSLRRATDGLIASANFCRFLSTLSLRRATGKIPANIMLHSDFYPRSPCGERLLWVLRKVPILDFYPRSPCGERLSLYVI